MKSIVALTLLLAVAGISQGATLPQSSENVSFKCKACKWIDEFILAAESLSGEELKAYLDDRCSKIPVLSDYEIIREECKNLVGAVVDKIEDFGHKFDQNELCYKLIPVC